MYSDHAQSTSLILVKRSYCQEINFTSESLEFGTDYTYFPIKGGITIQDLEDTYKRLQVSAHHINWLQIINNKIYMRGNQSVPKILRIHYALQPLLWLNESGNGTSLPDVELLMLLADNGSALYNKGTTPVPVWSYSRTNVSQSQDFLVPGHLLVRLHTQLTPKRIKGNWENYPWHSKLRKAIWRGGTTGMYKCNSPNDWQNSPRGKLVMASLQHPELIDAKFTRLVATQSSLCDEALRNSSINANWMKPQDMQLYAAVIDVDGHGYSGRFPELLAMNSPVIKQVGIYDLVLHLVQPYVHYVPLAADLSNLTESVQWVLDHPEESRRMVEAANSRMLEISTRQYLANYMHRMLQMYRCMSYTPQLRNDSMPLIIKLLL